jgi:hypothetical protein
MFFPFKTLAATLAVLTIACGNAQNTTVKNDQSVNGNVNGRFATTNTVTVTAPAIPEGQISNANATAARTFIDGSQIVGKDIQPGTYRTRAGTPNCTWTRRSGISGAPSEVLATARPQGAAIVTIKATDKAFESIGCGMWTSDLSRITTSPTEPFGDGEYQVGTDVAPGTWKAQNPAGCYWARLKAFTGEPTDVIANQTDSGIVKIEASDRGFETYGCGSWTKAE